MDKKKATGRQGWWFAVVEGETLPCIHKHWLTGKSYHDPFERHRGKGRDERIKEAVDAMLNGRRVVLTSDRVLYDEYGKVTGFERDGYIAVFEIDNGTYTPDDGVRFQLTKRLVDLK